MGWKFATSLASDTELRAAINTGQWQANTPAAVVGWRAPELVFEPVRLSDVDFLSAATDAPAHARYEGMLAAASLVTVAEIGFWPWGGERPMQGGSAQLQLVDPAGQFDSLLQEDLTGLRVQVRLGLQGGDVESAVPVARYAVTGVEAQGDSTKVIQLGDAHADLDEPLTRGVFLPNIPALAWQPQPVVIGAVASVPGLVTNSDGSGLWLSDTPLASVDTVLDRGDIMEPGTYDVSPDAQQLFMHSPPVGPVVSDVSTIGAGQTPGTLEQMLREIMRRCGKEAWSSTDAAAIDAASGYAGGGYYDAGSATRRQALAAILPSYGAWWWQAGDGVLRFARVVDPASVAPEALAFDIAGIELSAGMERIADAAPNLTRRMAYRPNARALTSTELVTDMVDVPPPRRAELMSLYRGQAYAPGGLSDRYRHADTNEEVFSVFWHEADAQAEIERVCALYAVQRWFYRIRLRVDRSELVAFVPGAVGRLQYDRYGLDAGKQLLIRRAEINWSTGDIVLVLWG